MINATAASLLGFLDAGPLTGWELAEAVEGSIGYFWSVTRSQIYRELTTLERLAFIKIARAGKRNARPCSITAAGRRAFAAWIAREPAGELIRFPLLLTVFFGDRLERGALAETTRVHRRAHAARLAEFRRMLPAVAKRAPFPAETVRFGIVYEEAVLRWFDALPWAQGGRSRRLEKRASP